MADVLGLMPFVPARDFGLSRRFYETIGFQTVHLDASIAILKSGGFGFILQDFYVQAFAENCMIQLAVSDVDAWWQRIEPEALVREFGVQVPRPPAVQSWGLKVGFLFDPAGVLWHVAQRPS